MASGVLLDCIDSDLCTLTYFQVIRMRIGLDTAHVTFLHCIIKQSD